MSKLFQYNDRKEGTPDVAFFCPGCKCNHGVWITCKNPSTNATWGFNNNYAKPTFTPSIKVEYTDIKGNKVLCHSFVSNGMIQFLGDCTHELKNQTIELPEVNQTL